MTNGMLSPISPKEARMKNPLVLAYVGDTVFDLYIRTHKVKGSNEHVNPLNRQVCGIVNARSQAAFADRLAAWMDEEETDIYRRGRNAKVGTVPKNMDVVDYHKATGLEAVVGYLFLTGRYARLEELFKIITECDAQKGEE